MFLLPMISGGACASAPLTHSFSDLPQYLRSGTTIAATDRSGTTVIGRLESLTSGSLVISSDEGRREMSEKETARIELTRRWTGRGALIGVLVGFAIGGLAPGVLPGPLEHALPGAPLPNALAGAACGAGIGSLAGTVVRTNQTVYLAPVAPGS
jgi:hypothetical protein